jgi:site-specific DNA-methyltransferase (adenine-specific)
MPKASGSGNDPYVLGEPIIAQKHSVCSQTFIYAAFGNKEEAKNFVSYIKTKFVRILIASIKLTQDCLSGVFRFVPLQDFSKPWTDAELYAKYGLTDEEIAFIESMIKPME